MCIFLPVLSLFSVLGVWKNHLIISLKSILLNVNSYIQLSTECVIRINTYHIMLCRIVSFSLHILTFSLCCSLLLSRRRKTMMMMRVFVLFLIPILILFFSLFVFFYPLYSLTYFLCYFFRKNSLLWDIVGEKQNYI